MDEHLIQSVARMVNYIRHRPEQPGLELEARIGKITPGVTFESGYDSKLNAVILRLISRLNRNAIQLPELWKAEKQYGMNRFEYTNGIRKTIIPRAGVKETTYTLKQKVDAGLTLPCSNREYDARISLSNEIPITPDTKEGKEMIQALKSAKPKSARFIHRATFIHTVPQHLYVVTKDGTHVTKPLQFQFDISKVSPAADNKFKATQSPAFYHCEVELVNNQSLVPLSDPEEERRQDQFVAQYLIQCLRALLGTTQRVRKNNNTSEVNYRKLPEASFSVLGGNI